MSQLPIRHCYWVVPNKFLAGEYPRNLDDASSQEKIAALIDGGVTAFIDLTEEDEGLQPYSQMLEAYDSKGISYLRFPIQDLSTPRTKGQATAILDAIDRHIEAGKTVYLHCWGGVGRTGVIVGCWLARHGFPGDLALIRLRALWQQCPKSAYRRSPETEEQEQYIIQWEEVG